MPPDARTRLIVSLGTPLLKLWFGTVRVRFLDNEVYTQNGLVSPESRYIGATWHRCAIFLVYLLSSLQPMIMFSRSRDGELLARFARSMGARVVRGSSSRGGSEALRRMVRHLRSGGRFAATVADGPRGPAFKAKPGLVLLAQMTGVPILPIVWSGGNVWTLRKTWDRTMLPQPFGEITVWVGDPIPVPRGGASVVGEYTRILERRLNRMSERLDAMCGYSHGL